MLLSCVFDVHFTVEAFIRKLSEHIGSDWKALARELKFSKTDTDAIANDNPYNLREQIYTFFYRWQQQEGRNASIEKLVEGLKSAKLKEPLRELQEAGVLPKGRLNDCTSSMSCTYE